MVKALLQAILFLCFVFLPRALPAAGDGPLSDRVVIVVNERDDDSRRLGEHYARKRGIPRENIIGIDAPLSETITHQEFAEFIRNPLQRRLIEKEWLLGLHSGLKDAEGRSRSVIEGHRISYLVLCRGLPLRISHDPARVTAEMEAGMRKEFLTNRASVDSELALLAALTPTIGFVPNPLFEKKPAPEGTGVIKVARLDGPSLKDAMALVDGAIEGERRGLRGRAYVDLSGPHSTGKTWLEETAKQIRQLGYDLSLHESKGVFPISARFDAPVLYFGWYAQDVEGPFLLDGFRFPPGALAIHIHSFSATTLRSDSTAWCGPLLARGAATTVGNVYEPYLELTHRPDLFLEWLREGGNVGDAAAYSVRGYSWQAILIGDPLYRPFARSLEDQLAESAATGDGFGPYATIRRMNQLAAEGRLNEAVAAGLEGLDRERNRALALSAAKLQVEARERRQAIKTLTSLTYPKRLPAMEVMLVKEAADLLSSLNEHSRALDIYEKLLEDSDLPPEVTKALLQDGILLASRLGKRSLTRSWRAKSERLNLAK